MAVLARRVQSPNHPLRLGAFFLGALTASALVASAAGAVLYIMDREFGEPARPAPHPSAKVDLPEGLVLVRRIDGPGEWEPALGFEPVMPERLPEGVDSSPVYLLQPGEDGGWRAGHIRYTSAGGPSVVLVQHEAALADGAEPRVIETDESLAIIDIIDCGPIAIQSQLYFDTQNTDEATARAIADDFESGLRAQCGG
jgi:hypothetical protein